jgi:hypothetical protein
MPNLSSQNLPAGMASRVRSAEKAHLTLIWMKMDHFFRQAHTCWDSDLGQHKLVNFLPNLEFEPGFVSGFL